MPHLVDSIVPNSPRLPGSLSLAACHAMLREAHDHLARCGQDAARRASLLDDVSAWGTAFKRVRVVLSTEQRPTLMQAAEDTHSLVEVINQCATMERLLDALSWAQSESSGLSDCHVVRCHPTTSSGGRTRAGSEHDNDLILKAPSQELARFEVSDVASANDSNGKEERDLRSLGVLREGKGDERFGASWPEGRVFLVVSAEFARRLLKRHWRHLRYKSVFERADTVVLEVLPPTSPSAP